MAGFFDNTTTTTGSPWGPLRDPTMQGVDFMSQLLARGPYAGNYTAPIDPFQTQGVNQGAAAAGGAGAVSGAYGGQGAGVLPGIGQAFDYYGQTLNGGSQNPWLTNGSQYMDLAGQFANNPYMDSSINAALRDPFRQLTEQQLPGIDVNANMMGQAGGSQQAIERGIATRGYADRASDVGAMMRMQGLQTGYGIADNAANQDYGAQQNSANNLFNMGSKGLDWMSQGYDVNQTGAKDLFGWGGMNQGLDNQQIQGQMEQFNAPWELGKSYGSYVNPLAGSLKEQTTDQNALQAYLLSQLGPTLGGIGGDVADGAWGWIKKQFPTIFDPP